MKLTDTFLRSLKATGKVQKHSDGWGLFLYLSPAGGKLWRMAYSFDGKQKTLSFGAYPAVSLKDARQKREEAKEQLAKGMDPGEEKKRAKTERYTFEAAGERWYEHHAAQTVPATHTKSRMYLDALYKKLAGLALPELDRRTLVDAVQAIQAETSIHFAHRAAGVLKNVIVHAYNEGRAAECHAFDLGKVLKPYDPPQFFIPS